MARRKAHAPEEMVEKLRQAEMLVCQGKTVTDAVHALELAVGPRMVDAGEPVLPSA